MKQLGQYAAPRHVVAHLSDPHLIGGGGLHYGVIDNDANLRRTLDRLAAVRPAPQAIVFTGDLADRAEPDAYDTLRSIVEPFAAQRRACHGAVRDALADPDPWHGFRSLIERICELHAHSRGFADAFMTAYPETMDFAADRERTVRAVAELARRTQRTGHLRPDFVVDDLILMLTAHQGLQHTPRAARLTAGPCPPRHPRRRLTPAGAGAVRELSAGQRVTLPALRQPVQTLRRLGVPLTVARTRWMLGLKRRFVILRDQVRLFPKPVFLAQMSQTAATVHSDPFEVGRGSRARTPPGGSTRQPQKSSRGPPRG